MLDQVDLEILECLKNNSRLQWKQIGEQVHMTGPAVANRIRRMEELGVIQGYWTKVNEAALGNIYCAFITVNIKEYKHTRFQQFIAGRDEIKEAHRVSGEPCYIMKVYVPDQNKLNELLDAILEYGHYKVNISMGQWK